jgi:hypothetical protein
VTTPRAQGGQGAVEIADAVGVDRHERAAHRGQLDLCPQNDSGQAHAAERGLEQGIPRLQRVLFARGREQPDRQDVASERPRRAVVLAVDVAGDRAADRHVLGPGDDRDHPPGRHQPGQQLADRHAGRRGENPGLGLELKVPQRNRLEYEAIGQLGGVAVAPAHAARQRSVPAAPGFQQTERGRERVGAIGAQAPDGGTRAAAPASHTCRLWRRRGGRRREISLRHGH